MYVLQNDTLKQYENVNMTLVFLSLQHNISITKEIFYTDSRIKKGKTFYLAIVSLFLTHTIKNDRTLMIFSFIRLFVGLLIVSFVDGVSCRFFLLAGVVLGDVDVSDKFP